MAVGKSSLNRVANAKVIAAAEPEVAAAVMPQEKEPEKKAAKKNTRGKIYAVGDKLPTHLL